MSYQLPEPDPLVLPTGWVRFTADQVLAAYLAGIEAAAKACEAEEVDAMGTASREDRAYNMAIEHCTAAIRALAADGLVERKG